jgi:hypothetical protein
LVKRTLVAECERLGVGREWPDDVGEYVDGHPGSDCEGGFTDPRVGVWADGGRTEEEPRVSVDDEPQHAAGRVGWAEWTLAFGAGAADVGEVDVDNNNVDIAISCLRFGQSRRPERRLGEDGPR